MPQEVLGNPTLSELRLRGKKCVFPGLQERNPGLKFANAFSVIREIFVTLTSRNELNFEFSFFKSEIQILKSKIQIHHQGVTRNPLRLGVQVDPAGQGFSIPKNGAPKPKRY